MCVVHDVAVQQNTTQASATLLPLHPPLNNGKLNTALLMLSGPGGSDEDSTDAHRRGTCECGRSP